MIRQYLEVNNTWLNEQKKKFFFLPFVIQMSCKKVFGFHAVCMYKTRDPNTESQISSRLIGID